MGGDTTPLPELDADAFLAWADGGRNRMLRIGSRMRSEQMRERFARLASYGAHGWEDLRTALADEDASALHAFETQELAFACVITAVLDPVPEAFALAATGLRHVTTRVDAPAALHGSVVRLAAQISVTAEAPDVFEWLQAHIDIEPDVTWAARLDFELARARGQADRSHRMRATDAWWRTFNGRLRDQGIEPFVLDVSEDELPDDLFARMHAPEVTGCAILPEHQPRVTIIVPTFNPGPSFIGTIESLHRQSWSNLEVLVVDDCSTEGQDLLARAPQIDDRVRVIRQERNGGAYRARDTGLAAATGRFVGFLDADDISHSRRIERQILPLLDDDALIATISRSHRVTVEGNSTYFGYLPFRDNMSSILFRREPVLERLGRFDGVRKGGDSEFEARVEHVFGEDAVRILPEVLSLVQLTTGSLSRADMRYNWIAGERVSYINQFRGAHAELLAADAPDWRRTAARPLGSWVAPRMLREPTPQRVEIAVLSDWTQHMDVASDWTSVVARLAEGAGEFDSAGSAGGPGVPDDAGDAGDAGARSDRAGSAHRTPIGLLRGMRPRFSTLRRALDVDPPWELVERGAAAWMNWADHTRVGTLIVTDPEYLTYLPRAAERGIRADRVVLVAEQAMPRSKRGPIVSPVAWAQERVRETFGVTPTWIAGSPGIAAALRARGADVQRAVFPRSGTAGGHIVADATGTHKVGAGELRAGNAVADTTGASEPATIGVVLPARVDGTLWSQDELDRAFPAAEDARVVVYDEGGLLAHLAKADDGRWMEFPDAEIVTGDAATRDDFLEGIDVLALDLEGSGLLSSASWISRSIERGIPVAMHRRSAAEFGELVTSFVPRGSRDMLTLLALDDRFRRERRAAAADAARGFGVPRL